MIFEKGDIGEMFEMLNGCLKNKNTKVVCAGI